MNFRTKLGILAIILSLSLSGCSFLRSSSVAEKAEESLETETAAGEGTSIVFSSADFSPTSESTRKDIEEKLDISKNDDLTWTYDAESDSWTMSIVSAVYSPMIQEAQGVSVNIPGAYIKGIDTDEEKGEDITSENYEEPTSGKLVIDKKASIKSSNKQSYTAASAPCIILAGDEAFDEHENEIAPSDYAREGFICVSCGSRGKNSFVTYEDYETAFTGDAPIGLVDIKNAVRFIKYNILLENLPGNADCFVSTGTSGGGALALLLAATGREEVFFDYSIDCGAVGIYRDEGGSYTTTVTIEEKDHEITDSVWGCLAYNPTASLSEANMAMAFEYNLNPDFKYETEFQKKLAECLAKEYMEYINSKSMSIKETTVGYDLDGNGVIGDNIELIIEYDEKKYADTNGYGGAYLDLYLHELQSSLQWYVDNIDYTADWTWFYENGNPLTDPDVSAMTREDRIDAFLHGRYARPEVSDSEDEADEKQKTKKESEKLYSPKGADSANYKDFDAMLASYSEDIESILACDEYGNNIVRLYDPLSFIKTGGNKVTSWINIVMGVAGSDMSLLPSLNLKIAWLNARTNTELEWQWDSGDKPTEILGESFSLHVDSMYGRYAGGDNRIAKEDAIHQKENGSEQKANGEDVSSWLSYEDGKFSFSLADAIKYRTGHAKRPVPSYDIMDYGFETDLFGNNEKESRHFDVHVLEAMQKNSDTLSGLFKYESVPETEAETESETESESSSETIIEDEEIAE